MSTPDPPSQGAIRILHLEDDPLDAGMVGDYLEAAGLDCRITRVQERGDFAAALEAGDLDIVLADHQLPNFDGVAALALAREKAPEVPFVFVSGAFGEELAVEALRHGATDYVVKQRLERLPAVVRRALAERAERAERLRAEAALRDSEALLRATFDNAGVGMVLMDGDGIVGRANATFCGIVGRQTYRLAGRSFVALIHPDDTEAVRGALAALHRPSGPVVLEARGLCPNGRVIWLRITLSAIGERQQILAVVEDVTAHVTAQRALATSEELFRTLADNIHQFAWMADASGWIYWYNERWFDYTGTTLETMQGWGWRAVHHPDHLERVTEKFRASLAAGTEWEDTFPLRSRDGEYRWFLSRAVPIRDRDDRIVRWFGTNTDITAQRAADEAVRRLNETLEQRVVDAIAEREAILAKLEETQRLETIGQLTGGFAHDFNNLLTPIIGNLDLLRRRVGEEERLQRLVGSAMQGAERAKTLVQRLLAFARRQVLEPRPVDVAALVGEASDFVLRSLGPDVSLVIEAPDGLPAARVDPTQLELALLNLAVNARDAMPSGGTLTVALDRRTIGPDDHDGVRPGDYVRIAVTDTGTGMDAETLAHAIEPFYSTKEIGKGTGLGLSMVHGLAAQSGGALVLSSRPGAGTRAEIWLPVASEQAELRHAARRAAVVAAASRPVFILLVDDEPLVRATTVAMLSDLGHRVLEAGSGAQALDLLGAGESPDLVITDYLMPAMTGAELAREIRARKPGLPILLATGYASLAGNVTTDLPLLPKPFEQAELAATVDRLIAGARPDSDVDPSADGAAPG